MKVNKNKGTRLGKREIVRHRPDRKKTVDSHLPKAVKPDTNGRTYWSGLEAEAIIQTTIEGSPIADQGEKLDVMVDPATAAKWLLRNKGNRRLSQTVINRFTSDMANGRWFYTHQGIAFDIKGHLFDGQHRMHGIINSGATVPLQVTINLPEETAQAIDQGRNRSVSDVATIATKKNFDTHTTAVAARMVSSVWSQSSKMTRGEAVAFLLKHEDAIRFACEMLPKRSVVGRSAIRAVIARAWYTEDHSKLERFCQILVSGKCAEDEGAAFTLREYLLKRRSGGASSVLAAEDYQRTEYALLRFLQGFPMVQVRPVAHESFPLPDEETEILTGGGSKK
jgi:hypothetical protein